MPKPSRNPEHLAFVRALPCCICGSRRNIEAHHTGPRGLSQKSSDLSAIPLCALVHHRVGKHSYHVLARRAFEEHHKISVDQIVRRLNKRPLIRIESGFFVVRFIGERYEIGPTAIGLPRAMGIMTELRKEYLRKSFLTKESCRYGTASFESRLASVQNLAQPTRRAPTHPRGPIPPHDC